MFKRIGDLVLYVDPSCKVEEELATSLQEKVCVHGSFSNDDRMKSAVEQTIEVVDGLDSANWLSDTILNADGTDSNSSSSLVLSSLQVCFLLRGCVCGVFMVCFLTCFQQTFTIGP